MPESTHDVDFTFNVRHEDRVAGDFLFVEYFYSEALARDNVSGVVDFGESATTKEFSKLVFSEQGVGRRRGNAGGGRDVSDLWHRVLNDTRDRIEIGSCVVC